MQDDTPELRRILNDRLEDILSRFWPNWVRKGKCAYPEPGGRDDPGSFQVYLSDHAKHSRGRWFRNSASIGGDEINLFAYGMTGRHKATAEVFAAARAFAGLAEPRGAFSDDQGIRQRREQEAHQRRTEREQEASRYEEDTLEAARAIWNACRPISGTLAEIYLASRGFSDLPPSLPLGFHPALQYPALGKLPALVCRVDDFSGDFTGIWRIFIAENGQGKAQVPAAKLGLGPCGGGAVRIGGEGAKIGLAEGLESAMGAWCLTGRKYSIWAGLSTSGVAGIELPLAVKTVCIFPDGDMPVRRQDGIFIPIPIPPGRKAALTLKERLRGEGVGCTIAAEPPAGKDYADLWGSQRENAA